MQAATKAMVRLFTWCPVFIVVHGGPNFAQAGSIVLEKIYLSTAHAGLPNGIK